MGRRRKKEGSKRRFKRRLTEFLFQALNGLMDRVIGPEDKKAATEDKKASKKRKSSRAVEPNPLAPPEAAEPPGDTEQT
jgi:hypothetical protein